MSRLQRYIALNAPKDALAEARGKFLAAIEGELLLDQIIRDGLNAHAHYVQNQIWESIPKSGLVLSEIFENVPTGDLATHLFDALMIVAEILTTLDPRSTLDEIAQQLLVRTQHLRTDRLIRVAGHQALHGEHHIVFECIGWLSMLFTPFHDFSRPDFRLFDTVLMSDIPTQGAPSQNSDVHRSVGSMLRNMSLLPISCPAVPLAQNGRVEPAPFMKLSVLCYASLCQIGNVSIILVSNLVEHCQFDLELSRGPFGKHGAGR